MTLNAVIPVILRFFTEFDRFSGQLYHSGWRQTYNVCKILYRSSRLLLLAKTITHAAARSLCDSWASCFHFSSADRNCHFLAFRQTGVCVLDCSLKIITCFLLVGISSNLLRLCTWRQRWINRFEVERSKVKVTARPHLVLLGVIFSRFGIQWSYFNDAYHN